MKTDTPETDAYIGEGNEDDNMTEGEIAMCEFARKMERGRNEWKANHDNQVKEKQQAELLNISFHMRIRMLESAIRNLRDVKGRYHSEMAYYKLVGMLPESKGTEL